MIFPIFVAGDKLIFDVVKHKFTLRPFALSGMHNA